MKLFSFILILGLAIILLFLRHYDKLVAKIFSRLFFFTFILLFLFVSIFPMSLNGIANQVGIGRPADLVMYCFCLGLIGLSVLVISKIRQIEEKIADLVREIALEKSAKDSKI